MTADLARRAAEAVAGLVCCRACPRECGADRLGGADGVCRTGRHARVTSAFAHFGEESCLVGSHGSGTVFFGRCNLACVFCQNADISQQTSGEVLDAGNIAELMLRLQGAGCHNINFVSPSHVVPQILEAVAVAVPCGLRIPLVYNSNGYDSVETLTRLDGVIDIYMPDFKFWEPASAARYCSAEDYPERARAAFREMHRQVGDLCVDGGGIARRGLLVRHLVMPGLLDESAAVFDWLASALSHDTFVNVMAQYRPAHRVGRHPPRTGCGPSFPEINRPVRLDEMEQAFAAARQAGLHRFAD
ncbi:MAG: radical SAM protein [Phycisphaerae bacterium]|nr:radical SAM protein [Phycisphaerae bacterium]